MVGGDSREVVGGEERKVITLFLQNDDDPGCIKAPFPSVVNCEVHMVLYKSASILFSCIHACCTYTLHVLPSRAK